MLEIIKKLFGKDEKKTEKVDLPGTVRDITRATLDATLLGDKDVSMLAMPFISKEELLPALAYESTLNKCGVEKLGKLEEIPAMLEKENRGLFKDPASMLKAVNQMKNFQGMFDPNKKFPKPMEQLRGKMALAIFMRAATLQRINALEKEFFIS